MQFIVQNIANLLCKILDYIAALLRQLRHKLPNVKYDLQFGSLCKVSLTLSI